MKKEEKEVNYDEPFGFELDILNGVEASEKKKQSALNQKVISQYVAEKLNFVEQIKDVELPNDEYIIFTDGKEQLMYDGKEFYIVSTVDSRKKKKKINKKDATDLYVDYFIKYQLNPILDYKKELEGKSVEPKEQVRATRSKVKEEKAKVKEAEKTQEVEEKEVHNLNAKENEKEKDRVKENKIEKDDLEI